MYLVLINCVIMACVISGLEFAPLWLPHNGLLVVATDHVSCLQFFVHEVECAVKKICNCQANCILWFSELPFGAKSSIMYLSWVIILYKSIYYSFICYSSVPGFGLDWVLLLEAFVALHYFILSCRFLGQKSGMLCNGFTCLFIIRGVIQDQKPFQRAHHSYNWRINSRRRWYLAVSYFWLFALVDIFYILASLQRRDIF